MNLRLLTTIAVAAGALVGLWLTPRTGNPGLDRPMQLTWLLVLLVYVPYSLWTGWKKTQKKPEDDKAPSKPEKKG